MPFSIGQAFLLLDLKLPDRHGECGCQCQRERDSSRFGTKGCICMEIFRQPVRLDNAAGPFLSPETGGPVDGRSCDDQTPQSSRWSGHRATGSNQSADSSWLIVCCSFDGFLCVHNGQFALAFDRLIKSVHAPTKRMRR